MPGKRALVDYNKCRPGECDHGLCAAVQACTHRTLQQEVPYERPMLDPFACQGCGDCTRACPLKAIQIWRM